MKKLLTSCLALLSIASQADEGMWQPNQLPEISQQLKQAGLKLDPNDLTNLTGFPMGAIVSLGGCTASFVSEKGLVATNHHCIYGSIQYNSTEENNLLRDGFLAKSFDDELQATPGSRIYVTEEINEVTERVNAGLNESMEGAERYKVIDQNRKDLVSECEADDKYRCRVVNFHGGLQYFLFKQLTIRDVRLVHAPAMSVGKYGGDIDNWMWPRHTGDYGFYRAYVGKDGQPADYHEDNVPYEPKHYLKVNKASVEDGDYIMVLGYPGRTNRYRVANEVENQFTWTYPHAKTMREDLINLIKSNSEPGGDARIKYESTLASLANYAKNYGSMIRSYQKGDTLERKQTLEADLTQWINADSKRKAQYGNALPGLNKLITQSQTHQSRDLILGYMRYGALYNSANRLYRWSIEQDLDDAARKSGYQNRDKNRFVQGMKTINRRYDEVIDKAIMTTLLSDYAKLPASERLASLDKFFGIDNGADEAKIAKQLDTMYAKSTLAEQEQRLMWMEKSAQDFADSKDPFIQLAVATYNDRKGLEQSSEALNGEIQAYRPKFMEALIAYYKDKNLPVYADANSTLRITYGNVKGYSPQDGLWATPFTRLEGIAAKNTGEVPFNASDKQLSLIANKEYGDYARPELGSVPVNYLGTLDITGGNSGSPTLNDKAEFVGLVFDGVYESIIGDWDYDPSLNRSIHVDVRYMLWVMEHIDGATNLIDEMDIVE
ncbi:S46 family peptidase [Thalassotalea litorea]|uniref:Dipeptidyl-peptidase n=1 Tax=Thalassotalea litorea TaxID=2020715 RepID=A0A5R9ISQ5_9GAMM|nr:S46 family peptidase [Thalassotalea litorea]TLU66341.1 S46 family peptidase [Thalassotalea litorea]